MLKTMWLFTPGNFGGAEKVVLEHFKQKPSMMLVLIKEARNPVHYDFFAKMCQDNHIEFKTLITHKRFELNVLKALKQIIKNNQIELVHSHGMKANIYTCLLPVKKVATQHGQTSHDTKIKMFELVENSSLQRFDYVIYVSDKQFQKSRNRNKIYIPNFFSKIEYEMKTDFKKKYLFIGRLQKEKGVELLCKLFHDNTLGELTVLGDGELKRKLEKKYSHNIKYLGFQTNISRYFNDHDALIMPSFTEGMPMLALEALGCGFPILASSVGALPELIQKEECLFKPNDTMSLLNSIKYYEENFLELNHIFNKRKEYIKHRFSYETWLEKHINLYNKL